MKMTTTRLAQMIFLLDKTTTRLSQSDAIRKPEIRWHILQFQHDSFFDHSFRFLKASDDDQILLPILVNSLRLNIVRSTAIRSTTFFLSLPDKLK